jgi:hypothetical protein
VRELETVVRTDFTDASKMLHGPFFVPARVQHQAPRDELRLWAGELHAALVRDWGHMRFSLRCTRDEELVIAFDLPPAAPAASVPVSSALCLLRSPPVCV